MIAVGVMAALVMAAGIVLIVDHAVQFAGYQNSSYRFSLRYPKNWQVIESPQPGVAVVFLSPKETALDVFRENINITIQPVPDEIASIKTFSRTIVEQMTAVFKTNIKIIEDKPVTFGSRTGHRLVFEAPKPDNLKAVVVWTIRRDQAYILTFMTTMRKYPQSSSKVEEALKSFQLK